MSINRSTSNYINLKIVKMETKEFKETPIRCDLRQAFIVHNFEELEEKLVDIIREFGKSIGNNRELFDKKCKYSFEIALIQKQLYDYKKGS